MVSLRCQVVDERLIGWLEQIPAAFLGQRAAPGLTLTHLFSTWEARLSYGDSELASHIHSLDAVTAC